MVMTSLNDVTDECINCHKEIISMGVIINRSYDGFGATINRPRYIWVHADTRQPKCDNDSGLYASGMKRP
jgi:hypothetical protein